MKRGFKIQNIGIFEEKDSFFIPKMQLMKKTQEYRPIPESKHSFYSGPFPVSDLGQAWMWSKRGLSLSWVWLVYDKAHQHCTGGNTPNLHNFSRPLFQLLLRTWKRLQARGASLNRKRTKCRLHYSTFSNSSTDRWFPKLLTNSFWLVTVTVWWYRPAAVMKCQTPMAMNGQ